MWVRPSALGWGGRTPGIRCWHWGVGWEGAEGESGPAGVQLCYGAVPAWEQSPVLLSRSHAAAGLAHLAAASPPQFLINREGQVVKRYSPMEDPYVSAAHALPDPPQPQLRAPAVCSAQRCSQGDAPLRLEGDREGSARLPVELRAELLPSTAPCSPWAPSSSTMTACLEASLLVRQTRRFGVHLLEEGVPGLGVSAGQPLPIALM